MLTSDLVPAFWLTYPGHFSEGVLGHIVGPSATPQQEKWVAADLENAKDKTRVGYIHIDSEETFDAVRKALLEKLGR